MNWTSCFSQNDPEHVANKLYTITQKPWGGGPRHSSTLHDNLFGVSYAPSQSRTLMCKRLGFSKCSQRRLTQGVQDVAVACGYSVFLCRFLRTWEPEALVDTLERSEC